MSNKKDKHLKKIRQKLKNLSQKILSLIGIGFIFGFCISMIYVALSKPQNYQQADIVFLNFRITYIGQYKIGKSPSYRTIKNNTYRQFFFIPFADKYSSDYLYIRNLKLNIGDSVEVGVIKSYFDLPDEKYIKVITLSKYQDNELEPKIVLRDLSDANAEIIQSQGEVQIIIILGLFIIAVIKWRFGNNEMT